MAARGRSGHASPPYCEPFPKEPEMPKMKTKSGAKKRFGRTASGKVKANVAHKRHRLISKPKQMKRKARGTMTLEKGDANLVLTYMPYMRG
jgi:large subunit ribosomal protein L35